MESCRHEITSKQECLPVQGKIKHKNRHAWKERILGMRAKCHEDCLLSLCFQCDVSSQAVRKQLWKKGKLLIYEVNPRKSSVFVYHSSPSRSLCCPGMCWPLDHLKEKKKDLFQITVSDDSPPWQRSEDKKNVRTVGHTTFKIRTEQNKGTHACLQTVPILHSYRVQNPVPRGWCHPQWRHLSTSPNLIEKILYKHAHRGV